MQKAFANAHGQFADKAKAAGQSTAGFAASHAGDTGKTGAQARLAQIGMKYGGGGGGKKKGGKGKGHAQKQASALRSMK
jgi:hypothetical protein